MVVWSTWEAVHRNHSDRCPAVVDHKIVPSLVLNRLQLPENQFGHVLAEIKGAG